MSQWYFPDQHLPITGPDLFSAYLNGNSAIYAYYPKGLNEAFCKKLVSWGYTPATNGNEDFHVGKCGAARPVRCFNGIDDDGDGKIDFPYDLGCQSASDDSETE
jgi:hypothetical protein